MRFGQASCKGKNFYHKLLLWEVSRKGATFGGQMVDLEFTMLPLCDLGCSGILQWLMVAWESRSAGGFSLIACHVMEMLKHMQGWFVHASMIRHNSNHIPTIMIAMMMAKPRNYKNRIICYFRLPETNSSHQKIDPWKRSVPYLETIISRGELFFLGRVNPEISSPR